MEKSKSRGALVVAPGNTRLLPPLQQQLPGKRREQILKPALSDWLLCPAPNEASWAWQHRLACSDGKHVSAGSWCVGSPARRETSFFATREKNGIQIEGDKHRKVQSFTVQLVQLCQSTRLIQEESLTVSLEEKTLHVDKWRWGGVKCTLQKAQLLDMSEIPEHDSLYFLIYLLH